MNILEAFYNVVKVASLEIKTVKDGNNRANNMGEGLEAFIKDAFAGTFDINDKNERNDIFNQIYSFQGTKRNPPDLMLKRGAAIEVKKTESLTTELQLNSSHPKQTLKSDSPFITEKCRKCEDWLEKDFIYAVGHTPKGGSSLSSLWFVYGDIYAAAESTYIDLKNELTKNIEEIPDIEFTPTKEIGRINAVDPLKITNLRVRGMWLLKQPYAVFDYIHDYDSNATFQCFAIIPTNKYDSFSKKSISKIEQEPSIVIKNVRVNHPDNPVELVDCKYIRYRV